METFVISFDAKIDDGIYKTLNGDRVLEVSRYKKFVRTVDDLSNEELQYILKDYKSFLSVWEQEGRA